MGLCHSAVYSVFQPIFGYIVHNLTFLAPSHHSRLCFSQLQQEAVLILKKLYKDTECQLVFTKQ